MKRGMGWPIAMGALLALSAGSNIWLARVANRDTSATVADHYYERALRWDDEMAQRRRNASLGWQLTPALRVDRRRNDSRLDVALSDRDGRPLSGARVAVVALHNALANHPVAATLNAEGDGRYGATLPASHPGMWELRFDVQRGAEHFTADVRVDTGHGSE